MAEKQLCLKQKIEFFNEQGELVGTSLIQDCEKDFFLVSIPLKAYEKNLLHIDDILTCIYYDKDEKVYMFQSKVLGRVVQNIPMYKLSTPEQFSKVQRRNYVRIPVSIPVKYMHFTPAVKSYSEGRVFKENDVNTPVKWELGTVVNLSGGGINICTMKPLKVDTNILMQIDLEGLQMDVKGQVVRCYTDIMSNQQSYHSGIRFIEISELERDKIICYIFSKFRERKQKDG